MNNKFNKKHQEILRTAKKALRTCIKKQCKGLIKVWTLVIKKLAEKSGFKFRDNQYYMVECQAFWFAFVRNENGSIEIEGDDLISNIRKSSSKQPTGKIEIRKFKHWTKPKQWWS